MIAADKSRGGQLSGLLAVWERCCVGDPAIRVEPRLLADAGLDPSVAIKEERWRRLRLAASGLSHPDPALARPGAWGEPVGTWR